MDLRSLAFGLIDRWAMQARDKNWARKLPKRERYGWVEARWCLWDCRIREISKAERNGKLASCYLTVAATHTYTHSAIEYHSITPCAK